MSGDPRRAVPAVDAVVSRIEGLPHALLVECAREAVGAARERIAGGAEVGHDDVVDDAARRVELRAAALLHPLVNATGVILHTNLGRAPLSESAAEAAALVGTRYSNLELRAETGGRGSRQAHAAALIAALCGAEAGLVVNNNAAAVLLVLRALARERDVVVSRGELVEIGGGFRVPDVMLESGCRLVEVGTTNRTRRADYAAALGPRTALVLKVHASNFRTVGFTEATGIDELAGLGVPVVLDAGSGLVDEDTPWLGHRPPWLRDEPGVRQALTAGASLVTFSGDKLFGGPQAGIVVGARRLVDQIARQPLARAVRADKLTLAALQDVASTYLDGRAAELPVWHLASTPVDVLRARAEAVARTVPGAKVVDTDAAVGGGSLPGLTIPSIGVALEADDPPGALASLRRVSVIARVSRGAVICDLRTVAPIDDARLAAALVGIAREHT